jgi:hypothetical protein
VYRSNQTPAKGKVIMSSVSNVQSYPTNPADYLNGSALTQSSSGSSTDNMLDELLEILQQVLSAIEGQGSSGGASGTPSGDTGASGGSGMPSDTGAYGGSSMPSSTGAYGSPSTGSVDGSTTSGSTGGMSAQDAAATLSSYMSQNHISSMTPDSLYSLSQNSSGNTPPEVSQAATYMLQNPSTYNQIETHDVAGADGIAGANDFQWAAAGGLGAAGNSTGVAGDM